MRHTLAPISLDTPWPPELPVIAPTPLVCRKTSPAIVGV
jgi:hypothetical protein